MKYEDPVMIEYRDLMVMVPRIWNWEMVSARTRWIYRQESKRYQGTEYRSQLQKLIIN